MGRPLSFQLGSIGRRPAHLALFASPLEPQEARRRSRRRCSHKWVSISAPYSGPRISDQAIRVTHVNQAWSSDITYTRMAGGFVYLVAVMDWNSRFVLS